MTASELLAHLKRLDIRVWMEGDQLRISTPKGVMSPELREELMQRKAELLALLQRVANDGSDTRSIQRSARTGEAPYVFPLSSAQERMWVLEQLESGTANQIVGAVELCGALDTAALRQALDGLMQRHEALRTTFRTMDGQPVQVIAEAGTAAFDVRAVATEDDVQAALAAEARRPFDLGRGPLLRALLLARGAERHVFVVAIHHIVCDGWSLGVFMKELAALYAAARDRAEPQLPALPIQYADYAQWQRDRLGGEALAEQLSYWRTQLQGPLPVLELPTDHSRPPVESHRGAWLPFTLSAETTRDLTVLGRRENATLFMVLMTAFATLLARYTGQEDVIVGTPVAGRSQPELEGLIGLFLNTLVLRMDATGDPTFVELFRRVRETALNAYAHQDVPFERLVDELRPTRDPSRNPLFQVMFALQNPASAPEFPGLTMRPLEMDHGASQFDLTLSMLNVDGQLRGHWEYSTDLFDGTTIERLAGHYMQLLAAVAADPTQRLSQLPLLTSTERCDLVTGAGPWPQTEAPAMTLHERFELQVRRMPDAVAATSDGVSLTYAELNCRANRLAHRLQELGVIPETLVGLCTERSLDLIVAVLGILKAGGAYLPIELSYPADRVAFMLADAEVPVLVTERGLLDRLPLHGATPVFVDDDLGAYPDTDPAHSAGPDNLVYVIYTSGSTGKPKGTMLAHRAVDRLFQSTDAWYHFGPEDVWTLFHSAAFDFSVWELWGALLYGGRVVVVPYWVSRSPETFLELLHREGVTVLNQTPSAFRQLVQADLASGPARPTRLRYVVFGGEALELQSLRPWFERHGDASPSLINMYGITETCVHVTYRPITRADLDAGAGSVIGVPIPDLRVHVLDAALEPVPYGVPGEMYVGGPGLARGYLKRPELTEARFVADPFRPGERLYRTGDLARRHPSGDLEYLGRIDQQVKIRGFRVELGEIDAVLGQCEGVTQSVVTLRQDGQGDKRLVAYLVATGAHAEVLDTVRARLSAALPVYMVPSNFVFLDTLPLTSNGKIDRQALPAPESPAHGDERQLVPLETAIEQALGRIWCDVLALPAVGRSDNFFELGGQSLLATQVAARIRSEFQCEFALRSIFESPVLEDLARNLETSVARGGGGTAIVIPRLPDDHPAPTSFTQERLWLVQQLAPESSAYNIPAGFRLRGTLDHTALRRALDLLIDRHEILRTTYLSGEDFLVQQVGASAGVSLRVEDIRSFGDGAWAEATRRAEAEGRRPFDLTRGPVFRVLLLQTRDDEHLLLLCQHHTASDHRSLEILCRDLAVAYNAFCTGVEPRLPAVSIRYRDFAAWQRGWIEGDLLARQLAYWREHLAGTPVLRLPTDRPHPAAYSYRGASVIEPLPAELVALLEEAGRAHGGTLFMTMFAAFVVLLRQFTGQDDIAVAVPIANRNSVALEGLVGVLVNTLVFRNRCTEDISFTELLERVRETALGAYANQDIPFERVVEELRPPRDPGRPILAQVFFNLQNTPIKGQGFNGLSSEAAVLERGSAQFELSFSVDTEVLGALVVEYSTDLFEATTIRRLIAHFMTLLRAVAESPGSLIAGLPPLPSPEAGREEPVGQLLERLRALDIRLTLNADRLKVSAPKGAVDDAIKAMIAARRSDIIEALRADIVDGASARSPLRHVPRMPPLPLSSAQRRLWFLNRIQQDRGQYNVAMACRLKGPADLRVMGLALDSIVERHEVLRMRIGERDGEPYPEIVPITDSAVQVVDLTDAPESEREAEAFRLSSERVNAPFDLARGPLVGFLVIRLAPDDHMLTVSMHHIAADGWSLSIAAREFGIGYAALLSGHDVALPPLSVQYVDYAAWEQEQVRSGIFDQQLAYWRRQLAGAPAVLEIPTDRPRPAVLSSKGLRAWRDFDFGLIAELKAFSAKHGSTLFITLLAAWQTLLHRYSGQDDIVVGTPMANRDRPELEPLIGFFVNNLVLRANLAGNPAFTEFLGQVRATTIGAFDHRDLPFDMLIEGLNPTRDTSHAPIFQTLLTLHSFPMERTNLGGLTLSVILPDTHAARFDVAVDMSEFEGVFKVSYEYSTDLFDEGTIDRMHANLTRLLRGIVADGTRRVQDLPLLSPEDERVLLVDWNDTTVDHDRGRCVHHLLEASARTTPEATAVTAGDTVLSYRELEERANRLAHLLVARGVAPGALVAICLDRTTDMPAAMAAVLKAGAAYVPLDPTHPTERLQYTLGDAGVACAITLARFAPLLAQAGAPLVLLDEVEPELAALPTSPVAVATKPEDLAYVIYTSGSTGRPKGVQVEHRNVVSFLEAMRREPGFTDRDVLLAVTTLSFDIAGLEFWLPLSVGGRVVIASRTDVLDGERLMALLQEHRVTVMQATPATWRVLLEAGWTGKADLKVLCGGEALARDLAASLVERVAELWNMYGPTETTIWSTVSRVVDATSAVPIGRPIANTRVYVLEPSGMLAPIGVPGELCIGGEGVASGYRNRPELTTEKFVTITLPDGRTERVYRTGDVTRFRGDGQLEFIGRRDHQVKVRGYRIELGEIEAILATHPGVKECVVTVREDTPGDQRLVGYVVATAGSSFDPDAARTTLRAKLPEYMIPNAFMVLAALPLTPNGKIDRKVLPAPEAPPPRAADLADTPMSPAQFRVAGIWQDVLRVDRVGLYDNFFDLGGHSLLLVKLHAALKREFSVDLTLVELFQRTTVAAQADGLSSAAATDGAMRRAQARAARQIHG